MVHGAFASCYLVPDPVLVVQVRPLIHRKKKILARFSLISSESTAGAHSHSKKLDLSLGPDPQYSSFHLS